MYAIAQAVLIGWLPLVLLLFLFIKPHRAVVVGLIGSWLFLPQLGYDIPLFPDYTKMTATCYAIIIGALLLDPKSRVLHFKPLWIDAPIVVWCVLPVFTSVSNNLGLYDGLATMLGEIITYGLPYLIGRLYFRTPEDAKDFALGIVIGGMIYVPLCLYEIRMSPQLHDMFYGFKSVSDWQQVKRWGGWRPTVFLQHGLAVSVWMAVAAAMAFWLWRTKAVKSVLGVPMGVVFPVLLVTLVLCKSTAAVALFGGVLTAMLCVHYFQTKALLMVMVFGVPIYLFARVTGLFDGVALTDNLMETFPAMEERIASLRYRMDHESAIIGHTWARPLVGWGGYARAFEVYLPEYHSRAVPDSMWIRSFGQHGLIGLISIYSAFLLGTMVLLLKMKPREWDHPRYAPVTGLAMVSMIYAMDCLFNNMINPVFIVAFGGVAGMAASLTRERKPGSAAAQHAAFPPRGGPGDRPHADPSRRQPGLTSSPIRPHTSPDDRPMGGTA